MKRPVVVSLLGLFIGGIAVPAMAQTRVRVESSFESWNQDALDLDEFTTFATASLPAGRSARIDLVAGSASASASAGGELAGLMNTRARLTYYIGESWVVRAGASIPTGKSEFDSIEATIGRLLTDRLRGYRGYRLGEGAGSELSGAFARRVGPATVGLGAAYLWKGPYTVAAGEEEYDPGEQVLLSVGAEVGDAAWTARLDQVFVHYGSDELGGETTFQLGARSDTRATVEHRATRQTTRAGLRVIRHASNRLGPDLVDEPANSHGPEIYLNLGVDFMATRTLWVHVFGGGRFLGESDADPSHSRRVDLGAGVSARASQRIWIPARLRVSRATLSTADGGSDSFGGFQATVGIELRR